MQDPYAVNKRLYAGPFIWSPVSSSIIYGPRHDKTCLQVFQQIETQISLISYRGYLEN